MRNLLLTSRAVTKSIITLHGNTRTELLNLSVLQNVPVSTSFTFKGSGECFSGSLQKMMR